MPLRPFSPEERALGESLLANRAETLTFRLRQSSPLEGNTRYVRPAYEDTTLGKALHILGTTERFGAAQTLGRLLRQRNPVAADRLDREAAAGKPLYASDYIRALLPDLDPRLRGPLDILAAAGVDLATYVGFGGLTKAGKAAKAAGGLKAGEELVETSGDFLKQLTIRGKQGREAAGAIAEFVPEEGIKFLEKNADALNLLTSEEKARRGLTSLIHLNVPFVGPTLHIGENFENFLKAANVPPALARTLGEEARGATLLRGVDMAKEAIRHSAVGQKLIKHFGFKSISDPRAVAIYHKFLGPRAAAIGRLTEEAALIEKDKTKIVGSIYKDLRAAQVATTREEVETNVGRMLNELATDKSLVGTNDAEFNKRIFDKIPDLYTSPVLGGPPHIGDTEIFGRIREVVRSSNDLNMRFLRAEAQAGIPVGELMGDTNYLANILSQEGRREFSRNKRKTFRSIGGKNSMVGLLQSNGSLYRRSFRNINDEALLDLYANGVEGIERKKLAPLFAGLKFVDGGVQPRTQAGLRRLVQEGKITQEEADFALGHIQKMTRPSKTLEKDRTAALELAHKLYDKDNIDKDTVNALVHPWTAPEVNDYVYKFGLRGLGIEPGRVKNFFTLDIDVQVYARGERAIRAISDQDYFNAVATLGKADPALRGDGWVTIPGLERFVKDGDQLLFDPADASFFQAYTRFQVDPTRDMNQMLQLNNFLLKRWKMWTLAIFPSYHSRNIVGNLWNNHLAGMGVQDWKNYVDAERFMVQYRKYQIARATGNMNAARAAIGELPTIKVGDQEITMLRAWEEGRQRNLFNTGFQTGDLEQSIKAKFAQNSRELADGFIGAFPKAKTADMMHLFGEQSWLLDAGFRVAGRFENSSKFAHFVWRLRKGDSLDAAANSARKHLFDYSELTDTERFLRGTVIPFYSWTRKNIPLQLEAMLTRPEKFTRIPKVIRGAQDALGVYDTPADENLMAEWMREQFPVRLRKGKDGRWNYFLMDSWLPAMDLNKVMIDNWWMTGKSMLSPIPKFFIEQIFNMDIRTGRKIDALEESIFRTIPKGERDRIFNQYLPRRLTYPAKAYVRLIRDLDKLFANPDDMAIMERLLNLIAGRVYSSDPTRGAMEFQRQLQEIGAGYQFAAKSQLRRFKQDPASVEETKRLMRLRTERQKRQVQKLKR